MLKWMSLKRRPDEDSGGGVLETVQKAANGQRDKDARRIIETVLQGKRLSSKTVDSAIERYQTLRSQMLSARTRADVQFAQTMYATEFEQLQREIVDIERPPSISFFSSGNVPAEVVSKMVSMEGIGRGLSDYYVQDSAKTGDVIVYRDGEDVVGFITMHRDYLSAIARKPGLRNTLVLPRMLEEVKKIAAEKNYRTVGLVPSSQQARKAYESLGFKDALDGMDLNIETVPDLAPKEVIPAPASVPAPRVEVEKKDYERAWEIGRAEGWW